MDFSNLASLRYVVLFIVLVLLQVLVCNNLLLFGVAVPFIYIYFIIVLPLDTSINLLMVLSFLLGFFIDLFSDTLGLNSIVCLLLAVVKKPVFYAYIPREDKFISAVPSIALMGWLDYLKFILTLSAIFCFLLFGIELFSFASLGRLVLMAVSSTILTLVLLVGLDALFNKDYKPAW